jgi:predicted metal-dependent peptidase
VDQEGLDLEPHALIYFTDGYAAVDDIAGIVNYPVLWATTGVEPTFRGQEFGEVIKLTM